MWWEHVATVAPTAAVEAVVVLTATATLVNTDWLYNNNICHDKAGINEVVAGATKVSKTRSIGMSAVLIRNGNYSSSNCNQY